MRPADLQALALDYDRTLTDEDLRLVPEALEALRLVRKTGVRIVIISGRSHAFLSRHVGHVADALVAENGCLLVQRGARPVHVGGSGGHDLRACLDTMEFEVTFGVRMASADATHAPLLREAIDRAGLPLDLVPNKDRVMVLPRGVDKASGLLEACRALGVPLACAAAAGDGENDLTMLRAAGYAVAVANAVPALKRSADHVTRRPGGQGLSDWARGVLLPAKEMSP